MSPRGGRPSLRRVEDLKEVLYAAKEPTFEESIEALGEILNLMGEMAHHYGLTNAEFVWYLLGLTAGLPKEGGGILATLDDEVLAQVLKAWMVPGDD